ncbi:sensor histidine kinase [Streptococcus dysgalactiae]|uniref:sensor histidine kinase n=1 Tax=Streptococcus dysgalactiae TaxID=1334 RepID=UPI003DA187F4
MKKSLIKNLVVNYSIILTFAFCLIFFITNFAIKDYVKQTTRNTMQSNFVIIDSLYNNKKIPEPSMNGQDSVYVWADYFVFDGSNHIKTFSGKKKQVAKDIFKVVKKNRRNFFLKYKKDYLITVNNKTYYVMYKYYRGKLVDNNIVKSKGRQSQIFHVINFADVTNSQKLMNQINTYLLLVLIVIYLFLLLIMSRVFKKVRVSFSIVENYISSLWNNNTEVEPVFDKRIEYSEFDSLLKESRIMYARIEKLEETQRHFFQNASHELRTPLMSIQGYAEGIQEGIFSSKEGTDIILQESKKMKALVDDIITISRLDSNVTYDMSLLNIEDIILIVIDYYRLYAKNKEININFISKDNSLPVTGNQELIERVISNVLSNALRYARSSITITLSENVIEIENDGQMIKSDELPHIFDRFYKGTNGNTGIGLAMCKEIMKMHDGDIYVKSTELKTTFFIIF